jgi:hypothetical protein
MAGVVLVDEQRVAKSSDQFPIDGAIRVKYAVTSGVALCWSAVR